MGMVRLAGVALVLLTGQVLADSIVYHTVELQNYNPDYTTAWKARAPIMFTPGSKADGQVFGQGQLITWDVKLEQGVDPVLNKHNQPGNPADGYVPKGAANLVFNLELRDSSGNLVSTAIFKSMCQDGNNGDALQAAAFACSYNLGGFGPGRLIDQVNDNIFPNGGPNLALWTFPTNPQDAPNKGKLLGQGAGYTNWIHAPGSSYINMTVPGVGIDAAHGGLGIVPVCEGQIDTTNMPLGTYTLKCIPGAGVNVLRGDLSLGSTDQNAFAVAANHTYGEPGTTNPDDTITFTLAPLPSTGTLTVNVTPSAVIPLGAQFAVNGGAWQNPGAIDLTPGTYNITFKDVAGYTTPAPQNGVVVTAGVNTTITGAYTYIPVGTLTVSIIPPEAVAAGAQFSIDSGATWQNAGQITLAQGDYTVTFKGVSGWWTPDPVDVSIIAGADTPA